MEDNPTPFLADEDIFPVAPEAADFLAASEIPKAFEIPKASETSESAESADASKIFETTDDLVADLRRQLRDADVRIRYLEGAVGRAERIAYDRARAELIEEAYAQRVSYYRNLRDAGARAAGRMPESTPAPLLMSAPRRGFWD